VDVEQSHHPFGHANGANKAGAAFGRPGRRRRFDLFRVDRLDVGDRIHDETDRVVEVAERDKKR
jgi:hypothetical protein